MDSIKIVDIIIPSQFKEKRPKLEKIERVKRYYSEYGKFDKPIIIDQNNVLVDNYTRYLIALEFGLKNIPCVVTQERQMKPVTYIVGKFDGYLKEYTWKLTKEIPITVGDKIAVVSKCADGKNHICIVTAVRIFTSNNPALLRHKNVVGKCNKNVSK